MELSQLNIAIIGAGKVAHSLAGEFVAKGFNVASIISKSLDSAKTLAEKYNIKNYSDKIESLSNSINLIILAVPDGQINIAAKSIAKLKLDFKKKIFVHLSGALNTSVLLPLEKKGSKTASMHILQTFPSTENINLKGIYSAVESESPAVQKLLKEISLKLGMIPFYISSEAKVNYHIAGVFASNFLVGNIYASQQNFAKARIKPAAIDLLMPILNTTVANIKGKGVVKALSGPVERNDIKTIKAHIASLKKHVLRKTETGETDKLIYISYLAQSLVLTKIAEEKTGNICEGKELKYCIVTELKKLVNSL